MNPLPTIPRPPLQRWRDLRLRGVPVLIFAGTLAAAVWLWNQHWSSSNFVGEVQTTVVNVTSPQAGLLTDLKVDQFDRVCAQQNVARVMIASPESLNAALVAIRADLQVTRARMAQDQQRNQQNHQQLRLDWLSQKVDLAMAQASLRYAEAELDRTSKLFDAQIVSRLDYDLALERRDACRAEVAERSRLVTEFEKTLAAATSAGGAGDDPAIDEPIQAAITAQEEQLRRSEGATSLEAPMDGVVSAVYRRPGENVRAGEAILAISSERPERIIGFIRQPLSFEPRVGDPVEVRTRGQQRQVGMGEVLKIGARLELFTQPLRVRGFDSSQERGLPVLVSLPPGLRVHPGELVDLFPRATQ